jgi:hypothetical protein
VQTHFTIQNIYADGAKSDVHELPLAPNEEAEKVCALFATFLAGHAAGFREKLPFLNRGDYELEWAAAAGGSSFATFYESGQPVAMGVLLSGNDGESDAQMLDFFVTSPLEPLFTNTHPATSRPLLLQVNFMDRPDAAPVVQLLSTALASVYFRAILASQRA